MFRREVAIKRTGERGMNKERLRKLKKFEMALEQIEKLIWQCNPEAMSHEDIELALESLVEIIPKLKEYWDENLKLEEDKL